jgi:hypothetical protein
MDHAANDRGFRATCSGWIPIVLDPLDSNVIQTPWSMKRLETEETWLL